MRCIYPIIIYFRLQASEKQNLSDGSEDLIPVFEENKSVYAANTDFPGNFGEIIETGYIREQKVVRFALYPVQYNPVSKKIKLYKNFNVSLLFINPKSPINKEVGIFRSMMHHTTLNYRPANISALTKLSGVITGNKLNKFSTVNSSLGRITRVTNLSTLVGADAIPIDYLIITHSSLFNSVSLTKLANHRKDYNRYDVAIVKVDDDVYNTYPSLKHYESIRNFIKDVYLHGRANHTGDGHLGYLLLAGDAYLDDNSTEMVPGAYPPFYGELEQAGDYYYACTGGDSDNLLDLMYGRLPVGNENELSNVVNKIISYEYNTNSCWRNNYTFVAGSNGLLFSYADRAIKKMADMIPSSITKSYGYRALDSDRASQVTAVDSVFGQRFTLEEYEDLNNLCGSRKLSDWLYDDPIAGINNGVHTFIYEGHGGWQGLGGESCGRQIFKIEDCLSPYNNTVQNRLHNNLYSFMIFCACNTGHFDNGPSDQGDCIAEAVLNLDNRGAIGVLAPARDSNCDSFGLVDGNIINKEYDDSLFIMGEAVMKSKINISRKFRRQYNLYGDPALNLWPADNNVPRNKTLSGNSDVNNNQTINKYILFNNYPNPFNPTTTISYSIPTSEFITLKVYDVLGKEVAALVNEEKPAGSYKVEFNAGNLSSGIYFYKLRANNYTKTLKLVLIK